MFKYQRCSFCLWHIQTYMHKRTRVFFYAHTNAAHQYTSQSPDNLQGYKDVACPDCWSSFWKLTYSEVNCLLLFIPHSDTTMTKRLKWGKFCVLRGPMYANSSEKKQKNERGFCVGRFLRRGPHNGKWMKSFSALKVLTQSAGHFNGSPNGRRAVWRWAAAPVCCRRARGSAAPHLDRRPVNFMLYLGTLHILCLPCQASFLPLIRRNEKYLTAAQISVISLWNRFRNGKTWGPAVTTCRSHICLNYTWPQHHMTAVRGERRLVGVGEHD